MVKLSNQESWKPWMAFLLEAIVLLALYFAGGAMQMSWGMVGLVLTEVMFLAIAVITALLHKTPLKEVFPFGKVTVKEVTGVVIFAIAGMMLNMFMLGISMLLLPNALQEIAGLSDFLYGSVPAVVSVLIVAVLPAICEEAVHRGAILSHLRSWDKDWLIVLVMGIFFGLFHLSPLRFLSTATMGAILSYLMVKKNNMIFPMLLHFCNNFMSSLVGNISSGVNEQAGVSAADALASINSLQIFGAYCIFACLAPILLVVADGLVCPGLHKKHWVITVLLSAALLVGGVIISIISIM